MKRFPANALISLGAVICIYFVTHDLIEQKKYTLGELDKAGIATGACFLILGLFSVLARKYHYKKIFSAQIFLYEAILFSILILVLFSALLFWVWSKKEENYSNWAIGVFSFNFEIPFAFYNGNRINPVLTAGCVKDVPSVFVADPFIVKDEGKFYIFFEVFNAKTRQGDIAVAMSIDTIHWEYQKIVLDEKFSLSFPFVFKWENEYYMIPETKQTKSIRLYKADNFPFSWVLEKSLLEGHNFVDNVLFFYKNYWYLFTLTENYSLRLFYSEHLLGSFVEHPKSPIVSGDANIARMAGPIIMFCNRIIRFAQDDEPYYGNQVWAFEIQILSIDDYLETKLGTAPFLKGYENWNTRGVHHISIVENSGQGWIAAVDGY